jgi:uncharacterized protein YdeI (YjbR/CyaY-like superfamily)
VPDEVARALGGAGRIAVRATFDGVPYRGSIVSMGGVKVLGVTKAVMAEAGAEPGDSLTVVVENDERPREVDLPDELAEALRRNPAAGTAFASLSYTRRREHASVVADAKRPETRARHVERIVQELLEGVPTTEA